MGLETCVSRSRGRSPHLSPAARGNQPPAGAFAAPFPAARDKAAVGCVLRTFPCRTGQSRRRVRSPHLSLPHGTKPPAGAFYAPFPAAWGWKPVSAVVGCVRRTFPCRTGLETCVSRRRVRSTHLSPAARGNQPPAGAFYAPFPAAWGKAAGGGVRRTFPCRTGLETCVSRRRVRSTHLSLPHGAKPPAGAFAAPFPAAWGWKPVSAVVGCVRRTFPCRTGQTRTRRQSGSLCQIGSWNHHRATTDRTPVPLTPPASQHTRATQMTRSEPSH
jgi:hypothetical protein